MLVIMLSKYFCQFYAHPYRGTALAFRTIYMLGCKFNIFSYKIRQIKNEITRDEVRDIKENKVNEEDLKGRRKKNIDMSAYLATKKSGHKIKKNERDEGEK